MTGQTVVATANVLYQLGSRDAREALASVLETGPDLVGLQEWNVTRYRLLRETGSVQLMPRLGPPRRRGRRRATGGYQWVTPFLGGCAVGARAGRFVLLDSRSRTLSGPGRAERPDHWLNLEPPRIATVAVYHDTERDRTVCLVDYHLAPGVQARGRYRDDRPVLATRHRHELRNLQSIVDAQLAAGHVVYAVGDSNFDGLRLSGLTSAWQGREHEPGTLGSRRKVDDVHGPGPATSLTLLTNASDHKALIVARSDR
jgi:endonuclease/exonuclease/phosphatase family metal-dependent hydrolase